MCDFKTTKTFVAPWLLLIAIGWVDRDAVWK